MRDLYGLDCLVGWDQAYCDYMNTSRAYCSYNDAEVNTGPYCWIDSNLNNIYCDDNEYDRSDLTVGDCGPKGNADETKCKELCQNVTNCTGHGGKVYGGPDGRAVHRASKGFWANNMTAITDTEDMSPIRYMMDSNSTGNWPDYWMVRENTIKHCTGDVNTDGYMNLLNIFEDEADPEILVVRGRITRDGIASFDPFINIGNGTLDPLFKEDGDYRIVLIDGNGNLLAAYGFDVSFYMSDPDGGLIDEAAFAHKVGWKAGTTRMELRDRNGAVLAARAVSLNKPQVEITAPKDDVSGREAVIDVRWTAADEDGDSMSYSIALSADSGGTWIPLAVDLLEKKYALDASILQNGDYLVRVLATDGVNTGSAVSEFSIRAKSPAGPVAPATQHGGVQLQTVLIAVVLLLLAAVAATLVFIKKRRSQRPVV
jgi:hypothetical protein